MKMLYGTAKAVHVSGSGAKHPPSFVVGESRGTYSSATGRAGVETCVGLNATINGPCLITWAAPPEGALPL